jgi:hypothetical protein
MRIECTGPNGEKFEGRTDLLVNRSLHFSSEVMNHNENERSSLQKALETWCEGVKVDKEKAIVTQ